jgi:hypothetical protein
MQRHAYLLPLQLLAINVSAVAAASIYLRKSDSVRRLVYGPVLIVANLLNCVNVFRFKKRNGGIEKIIYFKPKNATPHHTCCPSSSWPLM